MDYHNNTFLVMPCLSENYWATKLVSFCPENSSSGLPSIYGTVALMSTKTGEPLAVMDGRIITAMRTAAVSALGIEKIAPKNCCSLGIIGTGFQGIYQAIFACSIRKISEIWVYDKNENNIHEFKNIVNEKYPKIRIIKAKDSSEVANNSEIIISATNSRHPVFKNSKELFVNKTIIGIGSYKPDYREFPEQLFKQADIIFVDTVHGKSESGDLATPIEKNWISEDKIYPVSDLLKGNITLSKGKTVFYKTVGCALFDLFATKLIYEKQQNG